MHCLTQIDSANVLFVPFPNFPPLMMMKRALKRVMMKMMKWMMKRMMMKRVKRMMIVMMVTQIGRANVPLCAFLHFSCRLNKMLIGSIITPSLALTLPYPTLPYLTLSYVTLPYLTLPYLYLYL